VRPPPVGDHGDLHGVLPTALHPWCSAFFVLLPVAVDDDLVLEALVRQSLLQAHPAPLGHLVEQDSAGGVVVCGGGQDDDADDRPQDVDGHSPLAR
jgi:hypothetical protein